VELRLGVVCVIKFLISTFQALKWQSMKTDRLVARVASSELSVDFPVPETASRVRLDFVVARVARGAVVSVGGAAEDGKTCCVVVGESRSLALPDT
jgi:hypothetical protein